MKFVFRCVGPSRYGEYLTEAGYLEAVKKHKSQFEATDSSLLDHKPFYTTSIKEAYVLESPNPLPSKWQSEQMQIGQKMECSLEQRSEYSSSHFSDSPLPEPLLAECRDWFRVAVDRQRITLKDRSFAIPLFNTVLANAIQKYGISVPFLVDHLSETYWPSKANDPAK